MSVKLASISNETAATVEQLAAMEFSGIKAFRGLSDKKRKERMHDLANDVYGSAQIAVAVCGMGKQELVQTVFTNHEKFGPFLMEMAEAAEAAQALLEIIKSAEARLAVALAVVEGEG